MKKYWKVFGIFILLAGIIYYPALRLYLFLTNEKTEGSERQAAKSNTKVFSPVYLRKSKNNPTDSHDGSANATLV